MAEPSKGMMLILVSIMILVAWLPAVTPIDYNTCTGGLFHRTCQVKYSSHCCESGTYLSATCCRNACTTYSAYWWMSSMSFCKDITESMCCSTTLFDSETCCNYASYSRTSLRSEEGLYYYTCNGGPAIQYCTNSLSRSCCHSGGFNSASCCRPSTCGFGYEETCHSTSTYCCYSSRQCCDYSSYNEEKEKEKNAIDSQVTGKIIGGSIGGVLLLLVCIIGPVCLVCFDKRKGSTRIPGSTGAIYVTAASNPAQPHSASPQSGSENQPPPAYQGLVAPQPQSRQTAVVPPNGSQPPAYEHHQPPSPGIDQPPPYDSLQQLQTPWAPQPPSGSNPVISV